MPVREPGTRMPTVLSVHAWNAATLIDSAFGDVLAECGLREPDAFASPLTSTIAKVVQLAINRTLDERSL